MTLEFTVTPFALAFINDLQGFRDLFNEQVREVRRGFLR